MCGLRYEGKHSDEVIATKLGFDGVEDMRFQLENWNLPDWLIGQASGPEEKTAQHGAPKKRTRKAKTKSVRGPVQELPPSKKAVPLFQEAIEKLRSDLKHLFYLQSGDRRTPEYLQDGRFIQDTRQDAPRWAPDIGGSTRIAVYLVAGNDPEPLIEKLHFDPDKLDREKLRRILYDDEKKTAPAFCEEPRKPRG